MSLRVSGRKEASSEVIIVDGKSKGNVGSEGMRRGATYKRQRGPRSEDVKSRELNSLTGVCETP